MVKSSFGKDRPSFTYSEIDQKLTLYNKFILVKRQGKKNSVFIFDIQFGNFTVLTPMHNHYYCIYKVYFSKGEKLTQDINASDLLLHLFSIDLTHVTTSVAFLNRPNSKLPNSEIHWIGLWNLDFRKALV